MQYLNIYVKQIDNDDPEAYDQITVYANRFKNKILINFMRLMRVHLLFEREYNNFNTQVFDYDTQFNSKICLNVECRKCSKNSHVAYQNDGPCVIPLMYLLLRINNALCPLLVILFSMCLHHSVQRCLLNCLSG